MLLRHSESAGAFIPKDTGCDYGSHLINLFSVPKDRESEFLKWLQDEKGNMTKHQGFISGKLHKSIKPDSKFNFINLVIWDNQEVLSKAMEKSGSAMQSKLEQWGVEATLDLYQVALEY